MIATERFEQVEVICSDDLWHWLEANHMRDEGVWLVTWKKALPAKYVSRENVLDALIAYGWTDGVRRKIDDERVMQLISPRRQQRWAQSYKDRVQKLNSSGLMKPSGLAPIEVAKFAGLQAQHRP